MTPKQHARLFCPRRTQVIGVGTAKSGTHSLAAVFAKTYRSAHEPGVAHLIPLLLTRDEHRIRRYLRRADLTRRLEVDSSQVNTHVVEHLVSLRPKALFVLMVRDPADFVASITRQSVQQSTERFWESWREHRFGGHEPTTHDRPLTELGLFPLDGYLSSWARDNDRVLDAVPTERLLVLATSTFSDSLPRLADFGGIPLAHLDAAASHRFQGDGPGVLDDLDAGYLADRVAAICGPTLQRLPLG